MPGTIAREPAVGPAPFPCRNRSSRHARLPFQGTKKAGPPCEPAFAFTLATAYFGGSATSISPFSMRTG